MKPNRSVIPHGFYCYAHLEPMGREGRMKINNICPYWEGRGEREAFCHYLQDTDDFLLWDQVKICGVNNDVDLEDYDEIGHVLGCDRDRSADAAKPVGEAGGVRPEGQEPGPEGDRPND